LPIEERPWTSTPATIVKCPPIQVTPGQPLYRIYLSLSEDGKHATIGIAVSHSISDGRTVADYLAVVRSALPCTVKYPLPKNYPLGEFGQLPNYTISDDEWKNFDFKLPARQILPDVEPTVNICELNKFPLDPIRAYCKAHKCGIQSILMAIMLRTFRIFGKLSPDEVIYSNVIVDTRFHPLAKPEFRNRQFYTGASSCYPEIKVGSEGNIDEDIRVCAEGARKAAATNDAVNFTIIIGQMINKETLAMTIPSCLPNMAISPVFTGSNVGRVNCTEPHMMVMLPCTPKFTFPLYGVLSDTHLHTTLIYPERINNDLLQLARKQMQLVIDHVSK